MLHYTLNQNTAIVYIYPKGPLSKADFEQLTAEVDPYIEQSGGLAGLIIETEKFPGWEDLNAAIQHFRFVRDHHRKIKKVAIVTDSLAGEFAENIASHFVAAKIQHFNANQLALAEDWVNQKDH
ncbi:STAS/SEC14 domain-containing protein [Methylophaga sp. OBS4]|uniref:STAS/SEC14 domain-containing protein n=1 Tax=Methylophaga sp. OBS4 TaxID=2991935 RepID=UPI00225BDBF2|nr:STAS/SEC14 domain-containing protein [Methylophaga sp. OBS4]MCX4187430.1 STAS/SEC14 domain-containing protein [Methylophaga sp. OBS4]